MNNSKNKLVNAHILLQCADAKHENTCEELRGALVDNFNEIIEADTLYRLFRKFLYTRLKVFIQHVIFFNFKRYCILSCKDNFIRQF